jgi:hypothetical protein
MLQPPHLQQVMMKFAFHVFHPILLWFRVIVTIRVLFRVLCCLVQPYPPVSLFALSLPSRVVAAPDALWGTGHTNLFLLLPLC